MTTEVIGDPPVMLVRFRIHTKDYDAKGKVTDGTTPWIRATPEMLTGLAMQLEKAVPTLLANPVGPTIPDTSGIPGARMHFSEDPPKDH